MVCEANDALSLADLPSDIIRRIIKIQLESFDDMSLISHRWNSLLKDRTILPPIKSFDYYLYQDGSCSPLVFIPSRYAAYFGVIKWLKRGRVDANQNQTFSENFSIVRKNAEVGKCLFKMFTRSSHVDRVKLFNSGVDYFPFLKALLRDLCIHELEIGGLQKFSKEVESLLKTLIRTHSIQKLVLNYASPATSKWGASRPGLVKFLPLAARNLSSIDLVYGWSKLERVQDSDTRKGKWQWRVDEFAKETRLTISCTMSEHEIRMSIVK